MIISKQDVLLGCYFFSEAFPKLTFFPSQQEKKQIRSVEKEVLALFEYINLYPPCQDLIREALETASISVYFYAKRSDLRWKACATCLDLDEQNKKIELISSDPGDFSTFSDFCFELHNAINPLFAASDFPRMTKKIPSERDIEEDLKFIANFKDETDYAMRQEQAEYFSYFFHHRMMSQALQMPTFLEASKKHKKHYQEFLGSPVETWEQYWETVNKPHKEHLGFSHAGVYAYDFLKLHEEAIKYKLNNMTKKIKKSIQAHVKFVLIISWQGNAVLALPPSESVDALHREYSMLSRESKSLIKKISTLDNDAMAWLKAHTVQVQENTLTDIKEEEEKTENNMLVLEPQPLLMSRKSRKRFFEEPQCSSPRLLKKRSQELRL